MKEEKHSPNELIIRSAEPLNLEMPFGGLRDWITPNEQFYVRCHFPVPEIVLKDWRLQIEGAVEKPMQLTYKELRALPHHVIPATVECAGNGRSFLEPRVKGVNWELGAVGNAEWSGVLLRDVLQLARVKTGAIEAILEGADKGEIKDGLRPDGEVFYSRSLPLEKANGDVLLAFAMNGEPLSASHGFPLRAIVPGWYGMAAVKWLTRIVLTSEPFAGYYQTIDYAYWRTDDAAPPELKPITSMHVKAQIARPRPNERLTANTPYRVHGAAWVGDAEISRVEISADEGRNWSLGKLLGQPVRNSWRFWEFPWTTPAAPGKYSLMARAVDSSGRIQPAERVLNHGTYLIDHWLRIEVEVLSD